MLDRLRAAGVLWVTVFTVPALAILVGLGCWQWQRKAWKDDLQQQIESRVHQAPRPLDAVLTEAAKGQDISYARVRLSGWFRHDTVQFYYAPQAFPDGLGWQAYTPLQLDDGRWIFVNRGFVPDALRPKGEWHRWQPTRGASEKAEVVGLIRPPGHPETFTPANSPEKNIWYWRDLAGMKSAVFGLQSVDVVPYFVDADKTSSGGREWPRGGTTQIRLSNRHLEYMLTWFGLALTLVGVWAAFVWNRLNPKPTQL